jgi:exopolyphosphatase/guanosine-5'-triphosphate,3'-diphosphate pyrophosphatase
MPLENNNNFAAIDIGSNAIRLLLAKVEEHGNLTHIKKLSLTRVPIRLGEDVFGNGQISDQKENEIIKSMQAFKLLMEVYNIRNYRACATSAMREAKNSQKIIEAIKYHSNIDIELINGKKEADLIFSSFQTQSFNKTHEYLFIDVGGGSTEITIFSKGKRIRSKSFEIGTVRALKKKVKPETWDKLDEWLSEFKKEVSDFVAIGTGGNINRYFKICRNKHMEPVSYSQLKNIYDDIKKLSIEERIRKYRLRADRADVIEPAGKIYLTIMKKCGIKSIIVPKVGLTDGIIYNMYKEIN